MNELKPQHIAALKQSIGEIMGAIDKVNDARAILQDAEKNRKAPYIGAGPYGDRLGAVVTLLFAIIDLMNVDRTGIDRQTLCWVSDNPRDGVDLLDWYKQLRDKS